MARMPLTIYDLRFTIHDLRFTALFLRFEIWNLQCRRPGRRAKINHQKTFRRPSMAAVAFYRCTCSRFALIAGEASTAAGLPDRGPAPRAVPVIQVPLIALVALIQNHLRFTIYDLLFLTIHDLRFLLPPPGRRSRQHRRLPFLKLVTELREHDWILFPVVGLFSLIN